MTRPIELGFRLSPQQRRVWRLQEAGRASCSSRCALRIAGDLDRRALRRALACTVARHEILRTAFRFPAGLNVPFQVILDPGPVSLPEVDLQSLCPERRSVEAADLLRILDGVPFSLERGEGWRAVLVRLGRCEYELLLALSAACADPGAFAPLTGDLLAAYACQTVGEEEAPEPPLQYADVAEWQNSLLEAEETVEGVETWQAHWQRHDIEALIALPLPMGESDRAPGFVAPREETVPLDRDIAGALTRLAGLWSCPLQVVILTAWKAVLQRSTGRDETLVGVLFAGRDAEELQSVVGPLARYLPVVTRLSPEAPFQEALAMVREAVEEAEAWGEYFSWDQVPGDGAGGFPVCFEVAAEDWELAVDGLRVRRMGISSLLDDISLVLSYHGAGEGLQLALRYNPRRLRRNAVRRLAGRLAALLGSVAERPEAPVTDHPAMAEDELGRWLDLSIAPPAAERGREGKTLSAVFEEQVDRAPNRFAVVDGDRRLTFRELDERANRLAHHLRATGAGPEVPVALCLERSTEAVVALLAVWKAGSAYVPLDPTQPAGRLAWLLEDTGASLLVTDSHLPPFPGVHTMRLDEEAAVIARRPADRPAGEAGPRNLAYVIYTSGSTGRPKGVQVEHRSALHLLAALEAAVLDPLAESGRSPDPLLASLNAPMIFDASVQQLALLLSGHALCIVPQDIRADGAALLAFLREQEVDLLDCTPSQLRLLVNAGLLDGPAGPRIVLTAGEAVDEPLWRRLAQQERTVCFNLYGPTECTVDATFHRIEPGSARPTIGRPLAGYEVFVLDRTLRPVPPGAPGELCLGGAGLARGYLRRPDQTAERFVPHPFTRQPGERLYRTGDLGRHLPDGDLEFLGRLDHQVKIRGFRIELGEIEAVLVGQAGVRDAVVVAQENSTEDRRLVAYVAGDAPVDTLRQTLRQRLPDYMMPAAFVMLAALPLTPSGKVDRKALPPPELQSIEESYVAPRTPVEEILAGIWAELLGLERVGAIDHFFDLGGHSLLATQVKSRLRDAFDVEMPLRDLFEAPVLADLAARVEAARRASPSRLTPPLIPLAPTLREGPLPLSFSQQRLWFIDQLDPGSPLYNIPLTLRIEGPLHPQVLTLCLGEIVRRHEALRTIFAEQEGVPVQVIRPPAPFGLSLIDLSGLPEGRREALALHLVADEAARPFDLTRGPLLRGVLLRIAEGDHVVALNIHHIVSDGWSMAILVREVGTLYAAFADGKPSPLPELPVQYADFAAWQRSWLHGEALENEISFWRRQLASLPPLLTLLTDRSRPAVQSFRGASRPVRLPAGLTREMHTLSQREGATLFMVLLAGFQALLARYSGQEDLAVGTPVAGRNRVEVEGLIGFFVNTLVLRGDLAGEPSFRELLGRVRETALAAHSHQDVPFEKLVQELAPERSLAHSPLLQVMLVLQNVPVASLEIRDLRLRLVGEAATTAKLDLTLSFTERNGELAGLVEHAIDLFDGTTIDRLILQYEKLLTAALAAPEQAALELPLLGEEERHQLLVEWRGMGGQPPTASTLHCGFEARARRAPDAPALTCGDATVSYGELNRRSNQLAHWLRRHGVGPETRVGLRLERSVDLVVGILGVLKAGGAYVPLDPGSQWERLAWMIEDAGVQVVVDEKEPARELLEALPDDDPEPLADGQSLAYVIYTSGSTGRPKGALVSHGNVVRLFAVTEEWFGFGEQDVWTLFHSYAFDFSVWEIWGALLYGGRLVVVSHEVSRSPGLFVDLLVHERVTVLNQTPSAFLQLAQADEERGGVATDLQLVIFGGEALDPAGLTPWLARHGDAEPLLVNMYGITETTVHVTYRPLCTADARKERRSVIGVPIPDLTLAVMDPRLQPVPMGVPGELVVGGAGLTRGYLGRPELTAERFVPDPSGSLPGARLYRSGDLGRFLPDGGVEYLGRIDHQVKIRGFRIELGEIEAALSALDGVSQAVVIVREDRSDMGTGDRRLVAYLTGDVSGRTTEELRQALRERLPDHMIPAAFVTLAALPLTSNGKVDRKALPAPEWQSPAESYVAPRTPVEEVLAGLWAEVLGLERVGATDSFFDLGGHSLLATRLFAAVRDAFQVDLPVRLVFEQPTLEAMARAVSAAGEAGTQEDHPIVALPREPGVNRFPVSFSQLREWILDRLEPGNPAYNIASHMRTEGPLSIPALTEALRALVRRHEVFRTAFAAGEDEPLQVVFPEGPEARLDVPLIDLSALPEGWREGGLRQCVRHEASTGFDLAAAPLLRARIVRLGVDDHTLLMTVHHIISDGWSMGILRQELVALYEAAALPELPVQYADYAVWQRRRLSGDALERQIGFWRQRLTGAPPLLELPTDRPRPPVRSSRGSKVPFLLPQPLAGRLKELARQRGATLFMVVLAGYQTLLARWSGQEDVVVGTYSGNRPRKELEALIGFFIDTLVLRTDLAGDPSFAGLASRVRETTLEAYAHRDVPFEKLLETLQLPRDPSRTPLFQALLVLQNFPSTRVELSTGVRLSSMAVGSVKSDYDLALWLGEGPDGLGGSFEYSTDLFDEATIVRFVGHLRTLLEAVVDDPERNIWTLPLIAEEEQRRQLEAWSRGPAVPEGPLLLHRLVEEQAARTPGAVAVEAGGVQLTYAELIEQARRFAEGVSPGVIVALAAERSPDLIVQMLGVLQAGAAYLPVDPAYPEERRAFMLADSGAVEAFVLSPEAPAYVLYTSGSTGRPKGVVVPHRAIASFVRAARETYELAPGDRVLQFASISFDTSAEEIWPALAAGATLVLRPEEMAASIPHFLRELERLRITVADLPTAFWHELVAGMEADDLALPRDLRLVILGGEEALADRFALWSARVGSSVRLVNTYGPTETTIVATRRELSDLPPGATVPIGRPIPGARSYVLDRFFAPVPPGVRGELWIGGAGVAHGYLGRPDLTAERFVPDPFAEEPGARLYRTGDLAILKPDGDLVFAGRADRQLKIRGYRIEPGEIETALRLHPAIHDAVVDARGPSDARRLIAWVVPREGVAVPGALELRDLLRGRLSDPLVPAVFVTLTELPLTPGGKVDRRALQEPAEARPDDVAWAEPQSALERTIAEIYRDLLRVVRVGLHDNFFDLGGHSLLIVRAHQKLKAALGREIPVLDLFRFPTVAALARHLGGEETANLRKVQSLAERQWAAQQRQRAAMERLRRSAR